MNILEELYYGNINISERDVKEGSDEQAAGLFFEHRITPVLMIEPFECICPVRGQPHTPEGHRNQQKNPQQVKFLADCTSKENHDWLNAPIRIINRSVFEYHTENKCDNRCGYVGNKQLEPPHQSKRIVHTETGSGCNNVNKEYDDKTNSAVFFYLFHRQSSPICSDFLISRFNISSES